MTYVTMLEARIIKLEQRLSLVEQFGTNQIDHADRISRLEAVWNEHDVLISDLGDEIYDLQNKVFSDIDPGV